MVKKKLNNRKSEALQRLDQLTHLNNAQRQLAIQQINNAETLNKSVSSKLIEQLN